MVESLRYIRILLTSWNLEITAQLNSGLVIDPDIEALIIIEKHFVNSYTISLQGEFLLPKIEEA